MHISSESDFDPFPGASLASAHRSDGQEITDEGHEADDETNTRREQQTDVNTRVDPIELKELKRRADGHNKVDTTHFSLRMRLIIFQGDDLCIS